MPTPTRRIARERGFSLTELAVVVVVMAVLATIGVAAFTGAQDRAAVSALTSDLRTAANELELQRVSNGDRYPALDAQATGLSRGDGTTLSYDRSPDGANFCLEGTSARPGIATFFVTAAQRGVPAEGTCADPGFPVRVVESCFEFDATAGAITGYRSEDAGCGSGVVIPSEIGGVTVTEIGPSAFASTELRSVVIPDTVTRIGTAAFQANQLTAVTIPDSVTSMGVMAFHTNELTSLTLSRSIATIANSTFGRNQLTHVTIPDSVTWIGRWAFSRNQLTSVTIPDSVTNISPEAFSINQLTSVEVAAATGVQPDTFDPGTVVVRRG